MIDSEQPGAFQPFLLANKVFLILAALFGLALLGTRAWDASALLLAGYILLTLLYWLAALRSNRSAWHWLGYGLDLALVLYLIYASGGMTSPFWPLLALQVLFPAFYLPQPLLIWMGAFASGPLYVALLWQHRGSLAFLPDPLFLARYGVLFLAALISALAAERLHQTRQRQQDLQRTLATREAALDAQTQRLQRTAADLGDRVLQLRSLQEIARSLAATLDLPDTLAVLVERLGALTEARHAAIALLDADGERLRGAAATGNAGAAFRRFQLDLLAQPADAALLRQGNLLSSREGERPGFAQLRQMWGDQTILCLPLTLRGQPLGALYLSGEEPDFDSERQRQWLDSVSYFAAAAVENARLYQIVADKSRELETILAGIGDGVLVVDADLQLVLMNPIAARMLALEAPPPLGLPAAAFLANEAFLTLLEEVRADPAAALIREVELASAPDARPYTYQALAAPLLVGDSLQGIATVLRDVTGQKEVERMKSNFLSVVSHELKTPLHSIKGFVDIILMNKTGPVTEIQRDFLETVKQQTDHLQRMIDDLLEFSRLESGRVTLRLQPVDLPVVVEAVIDKLTPLADSAEVHLINQAPEDLPTFSADPWRLEQVVTNLVDNAIKFTPAHGSVTIHAADLGDFLRVEVTDTGIGLPAHERDRIFERFYQVDSGANRLYKGAGLGLTICRHIVEHHGGRIWVESEYGRGAAFIFTLSKHLQPAQVGRLDFTTLPEAR